MLTYSEHLKAQLESDPQYRVIQKTVELEEAICDLHPRQGLFIRVMLLIIGLCEEKVLSHDLKNQMRELPIENKKGNEQ
jgi:hypothetical protein